MALLHFHWIFLHLDVKTLLCVCVHAHMHVITELTKQANFQIQHSNIFWFCHVERKLK